MRTPARRLGLLCLVLLALPGAVFAQTRLDPNLVHNPLDAYVLAGRDTTLTLDLAFGGYGAYAETDWLMLTSDAGRPLRGTDGVHLVPPDTIRRDDRGRWIARVFVPGDLRRPQTVRLYVHEAGAARPKVVHTLPLRAPRPAIGVLRTAGAPAAARTAAQVALQPFAPLDVTFVATGGPFYAGTTAALAGRPLAVEVVSPDTLRARLQLDAQAAAALDVGPQPFVVAHPDGGWRVERPVRFVGPAPEILSVVNEPVEATDQYETVVLQGRHFSRHPRVRVAPAPGSRLPVRTEVVAPETSTPTQLTAKVFVPKLAAGRTADAFLLTVLNGDDRASNTVRVAVVPSQRTLKVETGSQPVRRGIPAPVLFEVIRGPHRFDPQGRYRLWSGGAEVPLESVSIGAGGDLLRATVTLPEADGDPSAQLSAEPVEFRLAEVDGTAEWTGRFDVHALPYLEDPSVHLRPGERRTVTLRGVHLEGTVLLGDEVVTVTGGALGDHQVTLEAPTDAPVGQVRRLPILAGTHEVGGLAVEVLAWAPIDFVEWQYGARSWQDWADRSGAPLTVDRDRPLWFRTNGSTLTDRRDQRVYVDFLNPDGALRRTQVLTARQGDVCGDEEYCSTSFLPGAQLQGGESFTVRVYSDGPAFADQLFYVKRSFWEQLSVAAGLSALQVPLGADSTRTSSLLDGVVFSVNWHPNAPLPGVSNLPRKVFGYSFNFLVGRNAEKDGLSLGVGPAVVLFEKIHVGVSLGDGTSLFVAAGIDLSSLRLGL